MLALIVGIIREGVASDGTGASNKYVFLCCSLYQPSSRRPVAFSPSADMGLTDIEMSHNLDFDDPYFDDRPYEMEYEVCTHFPHLPSSL